MLANVNDSFVMSLIGWLVVHLSITCVLCPIRQLGLDWIVHKGTTGSSNSSAVMWLGGRVTVPYDNVRAIGVS